MAISPKIRGDYGRHPRGSNDEGSPKGPVADRLVARGGQSPLGNNAVFRNATSGANAGPGADRQVSKSGSNDQYGASEREYQNPAMDDLDRFYGYGRKG